LPIEKTMTFEEMVSLIQKLPAREPIPDAFHQALAGHDSRAVALLLKDLSRVGRDKRAVELFDWLRSQNERSPLRALCDVFTYTAMISMCIYQQVC
jgi:pentatricopeptide repeat domain-containing protein 1